MAKSPTIVNSFVQVDEVTHLLNATATSDAPLYIARNVTYRKLDMIHGRYNKIKFDMSRVIVDPEATGLDY